MRRRSMTVVCLVLLGTFLFLAGCSTVQGSRGALLGTAVGGASGALIDKRNPWRGALLGGGLGAILGGGLGEIAGSSQGNYDNGYRDRDRRYRNQSRNNYYR